MQNIFDIEALLAVRQVNYCQQHLKVQKSIFIISNMI